MSFAQFHTAPAHVWNYQAQIRLAVKLRYLTGLARRVCSHRHPRVPAGEGAARRARRAAGMIDGMVRHGGQRAMEGNEGPLNQGKFFIPDAPRWPRANVLAQRLYPGDRIDRDLAGGGTSHAAFVGNRLRQSESPR
jgi:4-hydroxyphenylacetate 3-monooxygenase